MTDSDADWLRLRSNGLSVAIDPQGAQLSMLRDESGRDLLWNGDAAIWAGRAPLLFPIVGSLAGGHYRLGDRHYSLPRHGFARGSRFTVLERDASRALLRLAAGQATRDHYPFEFELDVEYVVQEATLRVTTTVRNVGTHAMPASFGHHPAFRWPLPYGAGRAEHFVEFALPEPAPMRRLDPNGLLTAQAHETPIVGRRLALADSLFVDDVIIFDQVRSRSLSYGADTGRRIEIRFPDSPYLGLWTKPQANFICIEPWHGVADPQGFSGDFLAKPGVFSVAAGTEKTIQMSIALI